MSNQPDTPTPTGTGVDRATGFELTGPEEPSEPSIRTALERNRAFAGGDHHPRRALTSRTNRTPPRVRASMALLKVHMLSSRAARVTDPLLDHETLVRGGHGWLFSRGWPPVEC